MASTDRTMIAPLLLPFFPAMKGATSPDWNMFLDDITGLNTDFSEPNATAFDRWRKAIAEQHGLSVWTYSAHQIDEMKLRGEEMKAKEDKRQQCQADLLAYLAKVAPTKKPADLVADAKKAARS